MHSAMTTPAIAGCTPDSSMASHSTTPATKYAGPRHTLRRPSARMTMVAPAAIASGSTDTSSE